MCGHYHYDGEEYCEACLEMEGIEAGDCDLDTGEQDTPANCTICHKPLDYSLTADGVRYVVNCLLDELRAGPGSWNAIRETVGKTYYSGCRHVEMFRDWATDLSAYCLSRKHSLIVATFLARTEKPQYQCDRCHQWKPMNTTGNGASGYATIDHAKVCYECVGHIDREHMDHSDKVTLYLTAGPNGGYTVGNWAGTMNFPCQLVRKGKHNWAGVRYDVIFFDHANRQWAGTQYGDNTQICHCRRIKGGR